MNPRERSEKSQSHRRDRWALGLQVLLSLLGLHMLLAVGFTFEWRGEARLVWRYPIVGLLVMLLGVGARLWLSPAYRANCRRNREHDVDAIKRFAAGDARIPWRPALAWVLLGAFTIYLANDRYLGSGDTKPMLPVAYSLVHDHDLALDEFVDPDDPPYYVERIGEHFYSHYSLGPAVLAVPFVAAAEMLGADLIAYDHLWRLDKVVAALTAATSVMFVFLGLLRVSRPSTAVLLTVFYALGSQNWVISSQALWQHGPIALCAAIVIFIECYRGRHLSGRGVALQGVLLGFAVACRPTAFLLVPALVVLTLWRRPRQLPALVIGAVLTYTPFLLVHLSVYDSVFGPYHWASGDRVWNLMLGHALVGNLISPARGLLIYQPLLALAVLAVIPQFARRIGVPLTVTLLIWFAAHLLVMSAFQTWWGGHCWGPRFFTELMPALTVLCVPSVVWLRKRRSGRIVLTVLIAWSVLLQGIGALDPKADRWLVDPVDIDQAPQRLWDWSDPPFLYRLRGLIRARNASEGRVFPVSVHNAESPPVRGPGR